MNSAKIDYTSRKHTLGERLTEIYCRVFMWESESPAELAWQWFGRSLTLPRNELVG